jgi:hypothetical protein
VLVGLMAAHQVRVHAHTGAMIARSSVPHPLMATVGQGWRRLVNAKCGRVRLAMPNQQQRAKRRWCS